MDCGSNYIVFPTIPPELIDQVVDKIAVTSEEDWLLDTRRQERYSHHSLTESLVFTLGPDDFSSESELGPFWTDWEPVISPITDEVCRSNYSPGGEILRMILVKLLPGSRVGTHVDTEFILSKCHRTHVVICTNENCTLTTGNETRHFAPGAAFEINNLRSHSASNLGESPRIHLIFDYCDQETLKSLRADRSQANT